MNASHALRIAMKVFTLIHNRINMNKYVKFLAILILGLVIGNRVFNHLHAWLGVLIIAATIIFIIYKLIKLLRNEKTN